MEIFIIDKTSTKEIYSQMCECVEKTKMINNIRDTTVVIGGEQLGKILKNYRNKKLMEVFLKLTDTAVSVLCCRVSPK